MTYEKHRREVSRQIILPLAIGALVLIVLCVLVGYAGFTGAGDVSRWADISLIWLILPAMVAALVFLALVSGVAYGVTWLLGKLPPLAKQAQDFMIRLNRAVRRGADKAAAPFVRVKAMQAAWRAWRER